MAGLQDKFWNKRLTQLDDIISSNLTSLYTWALILEKSIADRQQWIADKEFITGTKKYKSVSSKFSMDELHTMTGNVIDFFINNQLDNTICNQSNRNSCNTACNTTSRNSCNANCNTKPVKEVNTVEDECDEDAVTADDLDIELEDETPTPKPNTSEADNMKKMVDIILEQKEAEDKELNDHMNRRRKLLLEQELNPFGSDEDLTHTFNTLGDPPASVDNTVQHNNTPVEEVPVRVPKPGCDLSGASSLSGTMNLRPSVAEEVAKAPTINALLRISPLERDALEQELFLKAKKKVQQLMPGETNEKVLQPLYFKEADRLLKSWMETH
jgi:hypothetical protein